MFKCFNVQNYSVLCNCFMEKKEYNYGQNHESDIKKDYKNSFYNKNIL